MAMMNKIRSFFSVSGSSGNGQAIGSTSGGYPIVLNYESSSTSNINYSYVQAIINKLAMDLSNTSFKHIVEYNDEGLETFDVLKNKDDITSYTLNIRSNKTENAKSFWSRVYRTIIINNYALVIPTYDMNNNIASLKLVDGVFDPEYTRRRDLNYYYYYYVTYDGKNISSDQFMYNSLNNCNIVDRNYDKIDVDNCLLFTNVFPSQTNELLNFAQALSKGTNSIVKSSGESKMGKYVQMDGLAGDEEQQKRAEETIKKALEIASGNSNAIGFLPANVILKETNQEVNSISESEFDILLNSLYRSFGISRNIFEGTPTPEEERSYQSGYISSMMKMITQEINSKIFTQNAITRGHEIRYDQDLFVGATLTEKTEFFKQAIYSGFLNNNEVRESINMSPYKNGDNYQTNANAVSVNDLVDSANVLKEENTKVKPNKNNNKGDKK